MGTTEKGSVVTVVEDAIEQDAAEVSAAFLIQTHVNRIRNMISTGKQFKNAFTDEQRRCIEDSGSDHQLNFINISFAVSKMSDASIAEWEKNLDMIEKCVLENGEGLLDYEQIELIQLFMALLGQLKPKSLRHLKNFLVAATDGEWVDGIFIGKGSDSEFRTIDQCSNDARREFGLGKN